MQSNKNKIIIGIVAALFMAGAVVLSAIAFPGNQGMAILSIIIVPFIISILITRNVVDALTIVWLNEIFFGMSGAWIKIGSIAGRGLLLIGVIIIYIFISNFKIYGNGKIDKTTLIILFYGIIFPISILLYGVIIGRATFSNAASDVMRFSTVLIYFPMRDLFRRHLEFCFGWLIGATSILSLLFVAMAIAPRSIKIPLILNWMNNDRMTSKIDAFGGDFIRAVNTPIILCFIGVFLGILYAADSKHSFWVKRNGLLLTFISIAPFIINFIRGPILGIALTVIAVVIISIILKAHRKMCLNILLISIVLLLVGYSVSTKYIEISLTKWAIKGQDLSEIVDPVRIEQVEKMIDAWLEEPIFGKGVGIPLENYSRENTGLAFEVQYPMVLYRVGLFGFIIIMMPFGWLVVRFIKIWKQRNNYLESLMGRLQVSMALSIFALLISSWTNPYFASVMTPLFFVMFLALNKISKNNSSSEFLMGGEK